MKELEKSLYFVDSTETDGKLESIMDYTISWTLRRAQQCYANEKPVLYNYSREILGKLLGLEDVENVTFKSVLTWKQWERTDLCVEVVLEKIVDAESHKTITENHCILIEDKYYTGLHTAIMDGEKYNQLYVYKTKFDDFYDSKEEKWQRHYILITCMGRDDDKFYIYNEASQYGFETLPLEEIHDYCAPDSESDIFNEFWSRMW